jgi:formate dehydrogenase major subunit
MNAPMNRRQFFRICAAGLGSSSVVGVGMSPGVALAEARTFKLARSTESRNTCPYCSVNCGVILYAMGDRAKNVKQRIFHIEGDADHPVSRGTLCAKGANLIDLIHSPNRCTTPEVREPGSAEWKQIGWDEAITRIAKRMKDDRDANFIEKNDHGVTVNRWTTTAWLSAPSFSNESSYLAVKAGRGLGMCALDMPARL